MMGRVAAVAVAVCGCLLAGAAPAGAVKSSKVGGLLYLSRTVKVPAGQEGSGYIGPCAGARDIVSGGVAVSAPPGKARVNGLVPDGSNDAWFSYVDVFGSRKRSFRSFAICSKGTFTYVVQDFFPVAAGETGSGTATCGAGEAVGGGEAPPVGYGDSRVTGSSSAAPASWTFAWHNTGSASQNFNTHVTCKAGWNLKRVTATEKVKPGRSGGATASCGRRRHAVGGGAAVTSNDLAYLAASQPLDGSDDDKAPDDAWRARFENASVSAAEIQALAICRR